MRFYPETERKVKVNPKRKEVIRLVAGEGLTIAEAAKAVGVHTTTVRAWLMDEAAMSDYREEIRMLAVGRYAKAMTVLDAQMADKNGWLAQGAAEKVARLCGPAAMGEDANAGITVRIEGLPTLGMPKRLEAGAEPPEPIEAEGEVHDGRGGTDGSDGDMGTDVVSGADGLMD